jgi:hypothetical protein
MRAAIAATIFQQSKFRVRAAFATMRRQLRALNCARVFVSQRKFSTARKSMCRLYFQASHILRATNDAHACALHRSDRDHHRNERGSVSKRVFDIHELLSGFAVFIIVL